MSGAELYLQNLQANKFEVNRVREEHWELLKNYKSACDDAAHAVASHLSNKSGKATKVGSMNDADKRLGPHKNKNVVVMHNLKSSVPTKKETIKVAFGSSRF